MKTRVYELAKELNMETKELLDKLQELNLPPMTHLSGVDEETANMVRDLFLEEDKVAVKERPKKKIRKAKEDTESIDKNSNKAKKSAKPEAKKTNVKEDRREEVKKESAENNNQARNKKNKNNKNNNNNNNNNMVN